MSGYTVSYQNTATVTIAPLATQSSDASPTNDESPAAITDGSLVLPFAALGIQYVSSSDAQPIISADTDLEPASNGAALVGVETSLNLDGIQGGTQVLTPPAGRLQTVSIASPPRSTPARLPPGVIIGR